MRRAILNLSLVFVLTFLCTSARSAPPEGKRTVPVIYSTDLYHPHVDLDDHFDLVQLFALAELDIRGIILDINGNLGRSGRVAVDQMTALTGRKVRTAVGLKNRLRSPDDKAADPDDTEIGGLAEALLGRARRHVKAVPTATGRLAVIARPAPRTPSLMFDTAKRRPVYSPTCGV